MVLAQVLIDRYGKDLTAQEAAEANSFTIEYKDAEIPEFDDTFEEKPTEDEDEDEGEK